MAIERFPHPPITNLFGLANSSFDPNAFQHECEQFAAFEASSSGEDLWRFSLAGGAMLMVALDAELTGRKKPNGWPEYRLLAVSCAILSVCWWDTFLKSAHVNLQSWQEERKEFDEYYSDSLSRAVEALGPPRIQGADTDDNRHRYAVWRGETGLLVLQQSAYDPQFGHDVNYWVQPWSGSDPEPTSPFIDWLRQSSPNQQSKS